MNQFPSISIDCFKAYDIRGRLGDQLDEMIAYRIGRAYGQWLSAKTIVVGCDMRLSSEGLKQAVSRGLMDAGVDVIDLGMTGTEEVYFAAFHLPVDGGIEITASHNPIDYNGMKLVKAQAQPISGDSGLFDIKILAEQGQFTTPAHQGSYQKRSLLPEFIDHLMGYVDAKSIKPYKLVVNAGNGAAGHVIDAIEARFKALNIPVEWIKIHHEADGTFPNGIPNPIVIENQRVTRDAVRQHGADMGIAWDGDFDRCFLFDETGAFIEGYYIVGLLAQAFLAREPSAKVIHDPRLIWNTIDIAEQAGGHAIQSKTGHAFIKERMRAENAIYGGEMSAHHYFRDFAYCDSGMIPWLLVLGLLSTTGRPLSQLVAQRMAKFPCSGEINFTVHDSQRVIDRVLTHFSADAPHIDRTDGLSLEFAQWRCNIRVSNTEPLLRLNIESRGDKALVLHYLEHIKTIIAAS